jgi:hypothetical protein
MTTKNEWTGATIVLALVGQGAAIVWAVSGMVKDIEANTVDVQRMSSRMGAVESTSHHQAVTMARIDANLDAIRDAIDLMVAAKY